MSFFHNIIRYQKIIIDDIGAVGDYLISYQWIIPGDIHIVPDAVDLYLIPGMGDGAAPIVSSAGDHQFREICLLAECGKCPGITFADSQMIKQGTFRSEDRVGKRIGLHIVVIIIHSCYQILVDGKYLIII